MPTITKEALGTTASVFQTVGRVHRVLPPQNRRNIEIATANLEEIFDKAQTPDTERANIRRILLASEWPNVFTRPSSTPTETNIDIATGVINLAYAAQTSKSSIQKATLQVLKEIHGISDGEAVRLIEQIQRRDEDRIPTTVDLILGELIESHGSSVTNDEFSDLIDHLKTKIMLTPKREKQEELRKAANSLKVFESDPALREWYEAIDKATNPNRKDFAGRLATLMKLMSVINNPTTFKREFSRAINELKAARDFASSEIERSLFDVVQKDVTRTITRTTSEAVPRFTPMETVEIEVPGLAKTDDSLTWEFKTLGPVIDLNRLEALPPHMEEKLPVYQKALRVAKLSKVPDPKFSNYFVLESIGTKKGKDKTLILPGGNFEYGLCQALHGEESIVPTARILGLNKDVEGVVLGIITNGIAGPCGNCRDILLDAFGGKLEVVSGTPNGGNAIVVTFDRYLKEEYDPVNVQDLEDKTFFPELGMELGDFRTLVKLITKNGKEKTHDLYSPLDKHPERRYYTGIVTDTNILFGGREIMVDYHAHNAGRDAVREANVKKDPFVQRLIIVAEDPSLKTAPHTMYKDRQHFLEYTLQQHLVTGGQDNIPINLVTQDGEGNITNVWKTSSKEWLPIPFNPGDFGDEFVRFFTDAQTKRLEGSIPMLLHNINKYRPLK